MTPDSSVSVVPPSRRPLETSLGGYGLAEDGAEDGAIDIDIDPAPANDVVESPAEVLNRVFGRLRVPKSGAFRRAMPPRRRARVVEVEETAHAAEADVAAIRISVAPISRPHADTLLSKQDNAHGRVARKLRLRSGALIFLGAALALLLIQVAAQL